MSRGTLFRGQPILLLASVFIGWVGLRIALFGAGDKAAEAKAVELALHETSPVLVVLREANGAVGDSAALEGQQVGWTVAKAQQKKTSVFSAVPSRANRYAGVDGSGDLANLYPASGHLVRAPFAPTDGLGSVDVSAAAHPTRENWPQARPSPAGVIASAQASQPKAKRWSGDGWLLLRDEGGSLLNPGRPSYGRSQTGAVLRYRLDDGTGHRMQAYARVNEALAGAPETDAAIGLSGRPVAALPVRLVAELRATDKAGGVDLRPSVYAVTELAPITLPLGARAEAYVQAGYVAGANATAFVDGQVRVDKSVLRAGPVETRAGGGAWGGAQEGSQRLDAGPSVTARMPVGPVYASLSVDYRFRLAGNAAPASGPTLTLSAGF